VSRTSILILSADPLAAALLGAAVELTGFTPRFAVANESPRSALLRIRPALVLIDRDDQEACTDAFIGPALMAAARVVIFHSPRSTGRPGSWPAVRTVVLPLDVDELARVLSEELDP